MSLSPEEANTETVVGYKAPEQKTIAEILEADKDDESLEKYKKSLLGVSPENVVIDNTDPRVVLLTNISLLVDKQVKTSMDLRKDSNLDDIVFRIKEGACYQLQLNFYVQREIVTGMRYCHKVSRGPMTVDSDSFMIGSYAPKNEMQSYATPVEEAPSGMLHRGKYKVHSKITDDDGHKWMEWTWTLEIAKEW